MAPKIMHVEDDSDTRKAVRTLLKTEGFEVSSVMNGRICLNKLKQEKPDLILIDIMMPGMSGWDLFNKIRKRKIDSKVIFLSVLPIPEEKIKEMYKQGASGYIMKPFTPEELLGKIKKIVAKPQSIKRKKLSLDNFVTKIESKKKTKILSEIITNILILQTIKNKKEIYCQEIIEKVLSELNVLAGSSLINEFLSPDRFRFPKEPYKNLDNQIKKELISRFNIFVGSNVLYLLLSKWEKIGIVESKMVKRKKLYILTDKGGQGIKLLSNYFIKILKEEFNEVKEDG